MEFRGAVASLRGWLAQMQQNKLSLLRIAARINSVKDCYLDRSYQSGSKFKPQILTWDKLY